MYIGMEEVLFRIACKDDPVEAFILVACTSGNASVVLNILKDVIISNLEVLLRELGEEGTFVTFGGTVITTFERTSVVLYILELNVIFGAK